MYRLQVKSHFDAAHYIRDYHGKCSNMHGHRWDVEVVVEGSELNKLNMVMDFSVIKRILNAFIDNMLDHQDLNKSLKEANITAEWLAKLIFEHMESCMPADGSGKKAKLCRVTIWESPDCCVKYSPDMTSVSG